MSPKIEKIYENFMRDMAEDEIELELRKEVLDILKNHVTDCQKLDAMMEASFKIAEAGEEAGFIRGFRYAVQLMAECQ